MHLKGLFGGGQLFRGYQIVSVGVHYVLWESAFIVSLSIFLVICRPGWTWSKFSRRRYPRLLYVSRAVSGSKFVQCTVSTWAERTLLSDANYGLIRHDSPLADWHFSCHCRSSAKSNISLLQWHTFFLSVLIITNFILANTFQLVTDDVRKNWQDYGNFYLHLKIIVFLVNFNFLVD